MKKIFRLSAVVWFVVIFVLLSALAYGLSGPLTRWSIEKSLQEASGLPVTVDKVSVSLMPLSVTIEGVAWPDANNANSNAFVVQNITASVLMGPLLRGNIIVEESTIGPVLLDQARMSPWEPLPIDVVDDTPSKSDELLAKAEQKALTFGTQAMASGAEILKNEQSNLLTRRKAQELATQSQELSADLAQLRQDNRIKTDVAQLQTRFQSLSAIRLDSIDSIRSLETQWTVLKTDINQLKASILSPIERLNTGSNELTATMQALKSSPQADLASLITRYQPSNLDAVALSKQLFGEETTGYMQTGMQWYTRLKPWLPEPSDSDEIDPSTLPGHLPTVWEFATDRPEPGFWLKSAGLTVETVNGDLDVSLQHWTSNPRAVDKVATAAFKRQSKAGTLDGLLTAVPGKQTFEMHISDHPMKPMGLLPATTLSQATLSSTLKATVANKQLDFTMDNRFSDTQWDIAANSELPKVLTNGLSQIAEFDLSVHATGKLTQPAISITSNLDKKLGQYWKSEIDAQWARTKKSLEASLMAELSDAMGAYNISLEDIASFKAQLKTQQDALQAMLDGGLDQKVADTKAALTQKLADEKAAAQRKIDEEKAAAQRKIDEEKAAAQRKIDEEKKRLEDEAKKKLTDSLKSTLTLPGK